jgi:iron complex transport system substrate-binding protein
MPAFPPRRIVCLTEETVETLYLLGEQDRIVGVSGYAVRPPQVRREKPRVSAFISADIPKILALEPDLVLTFSDLQADIVAGLIRAGIAVHAFNQRDIAGILAMIRTVVRWPACRRRRIRLRRVMRTGWRRSPQARTARCARESISWNGTIR